jgi:eukaryotic-like serine/threonine-protein kinase
VIDDAALQRLRGTLNEPDLGGTRYRMLRVAGRGGMGTVYAVHDAELDREVALKVLDFEDETVADRLRQEARILARLEHPGLVPVHEVGTLADGRAFYTMKLVQGEPLDAHVAKIDSLPERMRIFLRICDAAAFAHSRGVLHRDLKPHNVMIGPFGEVLILDWGLAKVLGSPEREGMVLGTPGFMSPEQEQGLPVDQRTDVFSLGAILRQLLPERSPPALHAIAAKASTREPAQRYPDVQTLAHDIARHLDGAPVSAYREGPLQKALRVAARYKAAIGIVLAYLVGRGLILLFTHH